MTHLKIYKKTIISLISIFIIFGFLLYVPASNTVYGDEPEEEIGKHIDFSNKKRITPTSDEINTYRRMNLRQNITDTIRSTGTDIAKRVDEQNKIVTNEACVKPYEDTGSILESSCNNIDDCCAGTVACMKCAAINANDFKVCLSSTLISSCEN